MSLKKLFMAERFEVALLTASQFLQRERHSASAYKLTSKF